MRVAVMSDIHGFDLSLQTVLNDIDRRGPFDRVVVAGDLVEGGPGPASCVDTIRERGLACVMGNTDLNANNGDLTDPNRRWTRERLGEERLGWLASLPFSLRIAPYEGADEQLDLLIVHANPTDVHRAIHPDATLDTVVELTGGVHAAAIAFGHIHIAYIRNAAGYLLVDVAAVGLPKDGDIRSRWAEIRWDGEQWQAELHAVPVDTEAVAQQIRTSGRSGVEEEIRSYLKAG